MYLQPVKTVEPHQLVKKSGELEKPTGWVYSLPTSSEGRLPNIVDAHKKRQYTPLEIETVIHSKEEPVMEAVDYAARANLRRLMMLHPNWTRGHLAQATGMSKSWVA
jgi:hypothetical protein